MNRVAVVLLLLALAGPVPAQEDPRLRDLIQKLDDDVIDVRARAADALSKLGKECIPALRRAAADAGPERRDRLAEIIRNIEDRVRLSALLPAPSLITIEAKDRPLREVFQALAKQSRTPIDLTDVPDDAKVTVALRHVPFWIALEEICRASGRVMAEPDGDHVTISAEPYVALPQKTTDQFRVALNQIDLLSNGSFGQPDRFDHFTASLQVSWEKGARPWRVTARIEELVDDRGEELAGAGAEPEVFVPTPLSGGSIVQDLQVDCQHGPGPQAMKIARLKMEIALEFPLRHAEVRIDCANGKIPPVVECPEFSARLLWLDRREGVLVANLAVVLGATPPEGDLLSECIVLRDRKGVDHPASITEVSQSPEGDSTYQIAFPDAPEAAQLQEIVVRIPAEIHRERIEFTLKDLFLK